MGVKFYKPKSSTARPKAGKIKGGTKGGYKVPKGPKVKFSKKGY